MKEIIFYGRGGQGAVTSATLLVNAVMKEGLHGQGFPFFGAERRGAPVMAFARISDKPILRHGMFYDTDVLVILDSMLIESGAIKKVRIRENGIVIINTTDKRLANPELYNSEGKISFYVVDATSIAIDHGLVVAGWPLINTSILGAFSKATGLVEIKSVLEAIKEYFQGDIGERNAVAALEAYRKVVKIG